MPRHRTRTVTGKVTLDLGFFETNAAIANLRADGSDRAVQYAAERELTEMSDTELAAFIRGRLSVREFVSVESSF